MPKMLETAGIVTKLTPAEKIEKKTQSFIVGVIKTADNGADLLRIMREAKRVIDRDLAVLEQSGESIGHRFSGAENVEPESQAAAYVRTATKGMLVRSNG